MAAGTVAMTPLIAIDALSIDPIVIGAAPARLSVAGVAAAWFALVAWTCWVAETTARSELILWESQGFDARRVSIRETCT